MAVSRILSGVVIGGAFNAAAAYMVTPVFAPGALLWAANIGMIAGGLFGCTAACIRVASNSRSYDTRHGAAMGAAVTATIGMFTSAFAIVTALHTNNDAASAALQKAVSEIYGQEFEGAREGRTIPLSPQLLGGNVPPMIATFASDPQGSLYTASSTLHFRVCAKFNVAYAATPDKKEYEYEICNVRPLTQAEIGRIIPSFK